jgi:type IV secretion system protein VirB5
LKKQLIAVVLTTVTLAAAPWVSATGIPTVDVASILQLTVNAAAQAQQALDALQETRRGIEQARAEYEDYKGAITGNDRLGDFLNSPTLNKVLPTGGWSDVYSSARDLAGLRQRYGLTSDNPQVQAAFDKMLVTADTLEKDYDASTERVNNAQQLRAQLNVVQTPQQKQDLQLRYQQEMLELQNQQMRVANMQALMEQKEKIENTQRAQAFSNYLDGKGPLPKYD